jgi:hypothetical protein
MSGHWMYLLAPPLASAPRAAVLGGQAAAWVVVALRAATRRALRVVRRMDQHKTDLEASHE